MLIDSQVVIIGKMITAFEASNHINKLLERVFNSKFSQSSINYEIKDSYEKQMNYFKKIHSNFNSKISKNGTAEGTSLINTFNNELISFIDFPDISITDDRWEVIKTEVIDFINNESSLKRVYINNEPLNRVFPKFGVMCDHIVGGKYQISFDNFKKISEIISSCDKIFAIGSGPSIIFRLTRNDLICDISCELHFYEDCIPEFGLSISLHEIESLSQSILIIQDIKNIIDDNFEIESDFYLEEQGEFISLDLIISELDDDIIKRLEISLHNISNLKQFNDRVIRSITFSKEQYQAGVGILNYFGKILDDKYPEIATCVSIHQENETVKMIIECNDGSKEVIEKTLDDYSLILTQQSEPESLLDDQLQIMQLKQKLEIAAMEVRQTKELLTLSNQCHTRETLSLKEEIQFLRNSFNQLHSTNNQLALGYTSGFDRLIELAKGKDDVIQSIRLIEASLMRESLSQSDVESLKHHISVIQNQSPDHIESLKELALNTAYGISGNIIFGLLSQTVGMIF